MRLLLLFSIFVGGSQLLAAPTRLCSKVLSKSKLEQKIKEDIATNPRLDDSIYAWDLYGIPHEAMISLDFKKPDDQYRTELTFFGFPKYKNGDYELLYKVHRDAKGKYIGLDNVFLSTTTLKEIGQDFAESFKHALPPHTKSYIIPSEKGSSQFVRAQYQSHSGERIRLKTDSGKIRSINLDELTIWHFYFRGIISEVNDFFKAGGRGKLLLFDHKSEKPDLRGLYIIPDKFPTNNNSNYYRNKDTPGSIAKLQKQGIAFLIFTRLYQIEGVNLPKKNKIIELVNQNSKTHLNGAIVINPKKMVPDVLVHELQHYEDNLHNRMQTVFDFFNYIENRYPIELDIAATRKQIGSLYTSILEQRAYSSQINWLKESGAMGKDQKERIHSLTDIFNEMYVEPTKKFMNELKKKNPDIVHRYRELLLELQIESGNIDLLKALDL